VSLIKTVIFRGDSIIVSFLRDTPPKVTLYGIYNSTLSLTSSLPPLSLPQSSSSSSSPAPSNRSPLLPPVPPPPLYKESLAPYGALRNGVPSEREYNGGGEYGRWWGGGGGGEL